MSMISRRDFLKGSAASVLGLSAASLFGVRAFADETAEGKEQNSIQWAEAADLVVVGGGGAGFCAAIEAAKAGSSVLILEKADLCGGDTVLSGGMIMVGGSTLQEEMGIQDTAENFAATELAYCGLTADAAMVEEMCLASADELQFMMDCGREYDSVMPMRPAYGYDPADNSTWAPRTHWNMAATSGHFKALQDTLAEYDGAKVITGIEVESLIRDEAGAVIGVKDVNGTCYRANKGVVLATASFGRNIEMSKRYNPMNHWALTWEEAHPGASGNYQCKTNTGDGIRMAQEIGADLCLTTANCISDVTSQSFGPSAGSILVNDLGQRFVQESAHWGYLNQMVYNEAVKRGATTPDEKNFWIITDAKTAELNPYYAAIINHVRLTGTEAYFDLVQSADTLEELAEKTGLPADGLAATIARWNEMVENGEDTDFGRKDVVEGSPELAPIAEAPFYAMPYIPYSMGSFGGLRTNADTQVLDTKGEAIPRLYAAGAIMSGMYTAQFYNACGWSILGTVHWGRKAGTNVAALDTWTDEEIESSSAAVTSIEDQIEDAIGKADGNYAAGTYTATAAGRNGEFEVTVTVSDTAITAIEIGENTETESIGTMAIEKIPQQILLAQSAEVDAMSGATITSAAIIEAVQDCLNQAKK